MQNSHSQRACVDDVCLIADDADNPRQAIVAMDVAAAFLPYGLTVSCSTQRTNVLVAGKDAEVHASNLQLHIPLSGIELETITDFQYWAASSLLTTQ